MKILADPPATPIVDDVTRRGFIIGGALALVAVACGRSEPEPGPEPTGPPPTRQLEDAFGPTQVPALPTRIVADSVGAFAHLAALGVTPIAAAIPVDISPAYIGPGAGDVTNVVAGDGWTIDLEAALALRPDLIVAVGAGYNRENCDRYRVAMATFCYVEGYATQDDIKGTLVEIAMAIGREDDAARAIVAYDEKVASLRARIAAAGLDEDSVGVVRFDSEGFIGIRVGEATNTVLVSLGLPEPSWPAPDDSGYVELSLETLEILDAAHTLLICTDDNVDVDQLQVFDSPLWKRLDVVRGGRAHFVGAWNGADVLQLAAVVDAVERVLVVPAEAGSTD